MASNGKGQLLPQGCSSAGRASVSKTDGRGFESCHPCQLPRSADGTADDADLGSCEGDVLLQRNETATDGASQVRRVR